MDFAQYSFDWSPHDGDFFVELKRGMLCLRWYRRAESVPNFGMDDQCWIDLLDTDSNLPLGFHYHETNLAYPLNCSVRDWHLSERSDLLAAGPG